MIDEGRAPNDPAFAVGFMTARKLEDPDFAKMLLETRSRAGLPLRHDFFVNVSAIDWVGLGWVGLGWVGLGWVGLGWSGLAWLGLPLGRDFFVNVSSINH